MIMIDAASIFDPIADCYDSWYDTPKGGAIFKEEVQCLRHLGENYSGRWLEVGVGTGRFAQELGIIHGVDSSEQMAVIAKRRGIQVQVGSAMQLPFADSSFDGVLLALTLCFVVNPKQALREEQKQDLSGYFLKAGDPEFKFNQCRLMGTVPG
jgi:ubiquinone/menaquinone biosynthesis C-methylase UbiE